MTHKQERRCYGCRRRVFLVAWSSEWNWYSGFRKKTPSLETKLQRGAAFPSHQCFCREIRSAACNSSPRGLKIGARRSPVATFHITPARGCWGTAARPPPPPPLISKLHQEVGVLAQQKYLIDEFQEWGCSSRYPFTSPLPPAWMRTWRGSQGGHRGLRAAVAPEGQRVCLHFPPSMPAPALVLLPREQIVGCAWCSWPSPDVSPRVPAIDGRSKNSPCFPVYALRLPPRSSWIKTAGLDKIAFLFIALEASMVMVERGRLDLNRLLVAVGGVTWGDFAEGGC